MSTRREALAQLESFLDRVPLYERTRNYDRGTHQNVSRLSHWIRYRVISEEEVVEAVRSRHSSAASQKFLQEVLWRTYWKGWLEMHPSVWTRYAAESKRLADEYHLDEAYQAACEGRTKLAFYNDWVNELVHTGYLHNHTRMWFASVWIFTLRLPWQLGAAYMYHHLLDGDPASNTLSWRWVAGLHTKGKIYVARPDNIATYSDRRWTPKAGDLELEPTPLPSDGPDPLVPLLDVTNTSPARGALALLHDDDLSADISPEFSPHDLSYAVLDVERNHQSAAVARHVSALRADTAHRTRARVVRSAEDIAALAAEAGVSTLHSMLPPLGFEQSAIERLSEALLQKGISITWHRRSWDAQYMPLARSGFFSFWERVRETIE